MINTKCCLTDQGSNVWSVVCGVTCSEMYPVKVEEMGDQEGFFVL